MATVQIKHLNPVGSDLLDDSESYLKDLSDAELNNQGGLFWATLVSPVTVTLLYTL